MFPIILMNWNFKKFPIWSGFGSDYVQIELFSKQLITQYHVEIAKMLIIWLIIIIVTSKCWPTRMFYPAKFEA